MKYVISAAKALRHLREAGLHLDHETIASALKQIAAEEVEAVIVASTLRVH
jgi:hypothetical protein